MYSYTKCSLFKGFLSFRESSDINSIVQYSALFYSIVHVRYHSKFVVRNFELSLLLFSSSIVNSKSTNISKGMCQKTSVAEQLNMFSLKIIQQMKILLLTFFMILIELFYPGDFRPIKFSLSLKSQEIRLYPVSVSIYKSEHIFMFPESSCKIKLIFTDKRWIFNKKNPVSYPKVFCPNQNVLYTGTCGIVFVLFD